MANGMDSEQKTGVLGQTALFSGLTKDELKGLADCATERDFSKDEILFATGEEARGLFIVVRGAIRLFRSNGDREQVIQVEHAGTTVGEVAALDGGPYPMTAAAEEKARALFISKEDLQQFLLDHPHFALSALKSAGRRLRRHEELVESLALREVGQRLVRFLLMEARANGCCTGRGLEVELVLSKQQIAARVGTVREVVSRGLKRLQREGLIEICGRRLIIRHEASLETFGREPDRDGISRAKAPCVTPEAPR